MFLSDCLHKRQGVQNAGFWYYQTKQNKVEESTSQMEMRKALLTQSYLAGPIILTYSTFLALLPLRLNAKWQKAAFVERCKQGSIPHIRLFTTLIGHSPNFGHHM